MPESVPRSPKPRRRVLQSGSKIRLPPTPRRPIIRRASASRPRRLSRSASEPILFTVRFLPPSPAKNHDDDDDEVVVRKGTEGGFLPRPHTFTDGGFFSSASSSCSLLPAPSPPPAGHHLEGEAKVVVSVTVEGSPGPVRAMVRLGATVGEAIGVVADRYKREGRSPRLDFDGKDSWELHHSHFSLQSLNKNDRIGEVGSRSFYLHKGSGGSSFSSTTEGSKDSVEGRHAEIDLLDGRLQPVPPHPVHLFFAFIARRLRKIRRETKKLWRLVACIACV